MKIFNYNPNIHNQNNVKKTSVPVMSLQADRPVQSENNNFATNVYFNPTQISFGALKKTQFEGIDLAVIEKFKAPIEKFNSNDDLQKWAYKKTETIINQDFDGRQKKTEIQRKAILKEWADYVLKENDAYKNTTALLILNAITRDLKSDNDKLPPVLNKGVLADCIGEIDKNTKADPKYQFDLNKMYETKLRAVYLEDTKIEDENTGWVVIPSKENDPENFKENVKKLKTLSHKNWCTKSFNAEPYLSDGDFHVYLENGKPKIGIRFIDDEIEEFQGELNNNKIPLSYLEKIQKHIEDENLKLGYIAEKQIEKAKKAKKEVDRIKTDLKPAIKNKDAKAIFQYFNIFAEEDKDGFLTISKYNQPSSSFTFSDLGIDENILFEKVKVISGKANFNYSQITSLGNLESIWGYADFYCSQIKDLSKLKSIGGYTNFEGSQITDLDNLKSIGGDAYFQNSQITDLGQLKTIGQDAYFSYSKITSLGNLESIGGRACLKNSQVTDPGKLKSIGGNVLIKNSKLTSKDFENINIGGDIY